MQTILPGQWFVLHIVLPVEPMGQCIKGACDRALSRLNAEAKAAFCRK